MQTVLGPAAAPTTNHAERWRETINRVLGGLEVRLHRPAGDRDLIRMGDAGPLRIIDYNTGPGESRRSPRLARGPDDESYGLYAMTRGATVAEQRGRADRFVPGDLGLVDLSQPYRCRYTSREVVMVAFPAELSPLRRDEVSGLLGTRIDGRRGSAALLAGLLRQLPARLEDEPGAAGGRIASAVLDLLHAGLANRLGRESTIGPEKRRRVLLLHCRAFIEEHLADPALTPATVAAAHHVSLRYLHQVFEDSGDTVAGLIRRRRLDRCRSDLLDASRAARPVGAVGARWGFTEPTNFSRAFKRAFGLPPAAFRAEFGGGSGR